MAIVDDHAFARLGLHHMLDQTEDIVVVGECADGANVLKLAAETQPDVVLMDSRMPTVSGADATRSLLQWRPDLRVVMLTGSIDQKTVSEAAAAGAVGFVAKGGTPQALAEAVRTVAAGGTAWPASRIRQA